MPKKPAEQSSPHELKLPGDPVIAPAPPAAALPHRQQDRSDDDGGDDEPTAPHRRQLINRGGQGDLTTALPLFVRFKNLRQAGIVDSWTTLNDLIKNRGFPPGILLSPNVRAWRAEDVHAWLAQRPSERKVMPSTARRPTKQHNAETSP